MSSVGEFLRIAILLNGFESPNTPLIKSAFTTTINAACSLGSDTPSTPSTIDFYDPIVKQEYPAPLRYDLIVLSGGTADPMGNDPWVLKLQEWLRETVAEYPEKKILGICWGHQTIHVTFGGRVEEMENAKIEVEPMELTEEGKEMFKFSEDGFLVMGVFHRRMVTRRGKGFWPLTEKDWVCINKRGTILTLQGHPEWRVKLGKQMVRSVPAYMGVKEEDKEGLEEAVKGGHDGVKIWRRVLEWVEE